jgi:hypothetical protein
MRSRASRQGGQLTYDDTLARRGMSRWIALTIPTLAGVMPILEHTDLCTVLPEQWVKSYGNLSRLSARDPGSASNRNPYQWLRR